MEYRKEHRFDGVEISLALFFDLSREGSSAFLVDDLDLEEFWKNAVHLFFLKIGSPDTDARSHPLTIKSVWLLRGLEDCAPMPFSGAVGTCPDLTP